MRARNFENLYQNQKLDPFGNNKFFEEIQEILNTKEFKRRTKSLSEEVLPKISKKDIRFSMEHQKGERLCRKVSFIQDVKNVRNFKKLPKLRRNRLLSLSTPALGGEKITKKAKFRVKKLRKKIIRGRKVNKDVSKTFQDFPNKNFLELHSQKL